MKAMPASLVTSTTTFIKITAFSFLSFTIFLFFKHFLINPIPNTTQNTNISFVTNSTPTLTPTPAPYPKKNVIERTGIINEMGIMTDDFIVGEFDEGLIQSVVRNENSSTQIEVKEGDERKVVKFEKFRFCDEGFSHYVPCWDNVEADLAVIGGKYERHCPEDAKRLDCLVPRPKGYKLHTPWPKSRNEVWLNNMPGASSVGKKGQSLKNKKDKLTFQGDRAVNEYLDQISKMVPEIAFGKNIRVALDIGAGFATFGASLMEKNVTTLSISQKNVNENPIQLALERGVPAMIATFGSHRLPYSSQSFDLIHCSMCRIGWTHDDGVLLLEANRILRAGGYFVWSPEQTNDEKQVHQWEEIEDLTGRLCWEIVNKEEDVTIWQKTMSNSCYLNRDPDVKPSLCPIDDNPDTIWNINLTKCIARLPEKGYEANVTIWPARLHIPSNRLFSIEMDAQNSRRELYKADAKYWNDNANGYIGAFHVNDVNNRNWMDMKAGYGGFAAALHDFNVNCWVMNVVPTSALNTLPIISDRGLIGVMHDWCEPFDTYPRTYDMLHAAGLFSVERKRCNITNIMLEMDRMLRPGGRAYIRDTTAVIYQLQEIANAMGWVTYLFDSGEGPHSNWKLITGEKRM